MPLLDIYVDIKVKGLNYKYKDYYKSLGYVFPEHRTNSSIIRVKTCHLTKYSSIRVRVLCPICNEIRMTAYNNYTKSSDTCLPCTARIRGKLNKGTMNGQWGKRGEETPQYKDGRTPVTDSIRKSNSYKEWRVGIYVRDGFKCQCCEQVGGELQCHHIKAFSSIITNNSINKNNWRKFSNKLFDKENGITLCKPCHKKLHNLNGGCRTAINAEDLDKFLYEYVG